jgi:hypothetical protein
VESAVTPDRRGSGWISLEACLTHRKWAMEAVSARLRTDPEVSPPLRDVRPPRPERP